MIEDRRRYSEETEMHRSNGRSSGGERLFIEQIAAESLKEQRIARRWGCLLYTSPSPRDATLSRMPSSA